MKKKLLFVAQALWIGGIETSLVNLLNRLDYDRYDVTCLILQDYQDMAGRLPKQCRLLVADRDRQVSFSDPYANRRLFHLMEEPQTTSKLRLVEWKLLKRCLRWFEMDCYSNYIKKQLKNEYFDTCIIYSDRCAEVAVKGVYSDHYLMYYHHGAMRHEFHDDYGYRRSEKVITVSESLAQKLRDYRPKYADKIIAVNNLADVEGVREKSLEQPELVFPKDKFNIVSCGRLSVEKGMDLAVEACAMLVWNGMTDLHWWIVGGGPKEEELKQQVRQLGIDDHMHFLGMRMNPYPYIRMADLYIQPSRFEGHSVTIMEARILEKPILATRAAAQEQILDGVTGALCDANASSIAYQIRKLYDNPDLRNKFQQALSKHDFDADNATIMARLYQLFDQEI